MLGEIVGTHVGLHIVPSGARALEFFYQAAEHIPRVERAKAQEYLDSRRVFLTAEGIPAYKKAPVTENLNRVRGHMIEAQGKVAMFAYFQSRNVDLSKLEQTDAEQWLHKANYAKPVQDEVTINSAQQALHLRTGHKGLVVKPSAFGENEYVISSMGLVSLVAHWARAAL